MAIGDMQQKNVVAADAAAAHAEPALTAVFLEPRDARIQCADNYASGASPVNPALTKLRQLVAGVRGAIFGDFAGAVQRTLKSLSVDGTGGAVSAAAAGDIAASGKVSASGIVSSATTRSGTAVPSTTSPHGDVTKDSVIVGYARGYWDGSAMVAVRVFNVRSMTRNSMGDYTVIFNSTMASPTTAETQLTMGVNPSVVAHGFTGNIVSTADDGSSRVAVNFVTIDPNAGALLDTSSISHFFLEVRGS